MAHNRPDNCLLLRDGSSYLLLGNAVNSALILRDVQGVGGGSTSGGVFSRGRWRKMREEEEQQRQAARAEKEREEKRKRDETERITAEKKAARKAKRLAEDIDSAIRTGDQVARNAQEAAIATSGISEAMERARLTQEAMRHAAEDERKRLEALQDQRDIEQLIELERQELLQRLHRAGLTSLMKAVK